MRQIKQAFGLMLAFFFIAIAVAQIIMAIGRDEGPMQIQRDQHPFIVGLKGRVQ